MDQETGFHCKELPTFPVAFFQSHQQGQGQGQKERKLGHRRVGGDGEVTYKKFQTTQLMGSIQLGMQQSVGSLAGMDNR